MGSVLEADCDWQAVVNKSSSKVIKKFDRITFFFQERPLRRHHKVYLTTVAFFLTNASDYLPTSPRQVHPG